MGDFSRNLRCFFGSEAVKVWSYCRDRERALRSVELYSKVKEQLQVDLQVESGKRGTLVRIRSNEVTAVRDKLKEKSAQRLEINSVIRDKEQLVGSFLACIETNIRAIFSNSPKTADIIASIEEDEKKGKKLDKDFTEISNELADAVYKQNAAEDPIEDLQFALSHLDSEIENCLGRLNEITQKINQLIVQECLHGSPLHLDLMLQTGFVPKSVDDFCDIYLDIHDRGSELIAQPLAPQEAIAVDLVESIKAGLKSRRIPLKANIHMSGSGAHHRKSGKSWHSFDVSFSGKVNTSFTFHQRSWDCQAGISVLQKKAAHHFHQARNRELQNLEKEYDVLKHSLLNQAGQLFELF